MQRYFSYIRYGTDVQGGLKKQYLRSGSQRHRHFVGFFNVPVQAPTRGQHLYGYSKKPPHLVAFYDTLGIRRTYYRLKPWGPHRDCIDVTTTVDVRTTKKKASYTFTIRLDSGFRFWRLYNKDSDFTLTRSGFDSPLTSPRVGPLMARR